MASTELATGGGFTRGRYFSRAWSLLTREKGWFKPVAVAAAANLVPAAGPLGSLGYKLEWARLVSWGADASPKRHDVHVGGCISSGWRGFLVFLVWGLLMGVIGGICGNLPLLGGLLGTLWSIFSLYLYMVVRVAALRATIYQKAGAGFSGKNLLELGRRDANGLLSIVAWELLCNVAIAMVCGLVLLTVAVGALPRIVYMVQDLGYYGYGYGYGYGYSEYYVAQAALELLAYVISAFGPTLIVLGLLVLFVRTAVSMTVYAALGLWIRQFDVANWGRSEEPLPQTAYAGEKCEEPVAPVAPTADVAEPAAPAAPAVPVAPAAQAEPTAGGEKPAAPVTASEPAAPVAAEPVTPAPAAPEPAEPEYAPDGSEVIEVESVARAVSAAEGDSAGCEAGDGADASDAEGAADGPVAPADANPDAPAQE